MLKIAILFALMALVTGALGYSGAAASVAGLVQALSGFFLILALVCVVLAALGVGDTRKALK